MTIRSVPSLIAAPFLALFALAFVLALVWFAGLLALIPALVFGALLIVIGVLDRSRSGAVAGATNSGRVERDDSADIATAILDSLPEAVLLLNLRRKVIAANQAARELLGDRATGHDLERSIRDTDALGAVDSVIAGEGPGTLEITFPVPVPRYFQFHAVKVYREDDRPDLVVVVLTDVTGTRRSEQTRADFVANVSHELRSPLSALVGFIETLQGPARDDQKARDRFLGIMDGEASRMTRLIDDLLSLSQVETSEHIQPDQQVDLQSILRRVITIMEVRAKERGMTIVLSCPEDLPRVLGHDDELIEVFQNLIDNAVKYGTEGSEVRAKVWGIDRIPEKGGAGIAVAISNDGEGIASEHLPRLTERFYRVDKGRSRSMGGTGLGLAIVKHIVSRHRGHLGITSNLGEGTVFTVYFPRARTP